MTERQYSALLFIHQYITRHNYAPTRLEIARGCDTGVSTVYKWVTIFEAMGYIELRRGWRGIEVLRLPGRGI